jgi:hypothetical protein
MNNARRAELETVTNIDDRAVVVAPTDDGFALRVRSPRAEECIEIEIRFETGGPVVRTRAAALELSADAIVAQCRSFAVAATEDIELRAGGRLVQHAEQAAETTARSVTVDASPGAIRLRANDDVQLLGEQILLNCERAPAMPEWVPPPRAQLASLPPTSASGDLEVIDGLLASTAADEE